MNMRQLTKPLLVFLLIALYSCGGSKNVVSNKTSHTIQANLDLIGVKDDKVQVTMKPAPPKHDTISFIMAKIIPGTYAIADYGRYVENLKAYDKSGKQLPVIQKNTNVWFISKAKNLDHITYLVNDTFDSEEGSAFDQHSTTIFSPAGTNILANKNFMLNMCGFVGYFQGMIDYPYSITITHPEGLVGVSALDDGNMSNTVDQFNVSRYADMVDSPIMYSPSDLGTFNVDGMDVVLSIYSPINKNITAEAFLPDLKKMMIAQKNYLGDINHTKKYAVLTYISSMGKDDAKGIGALEHNYSTTAVFTEGMSSKDLIDVISHEFFHTLTPLYVHSKEIQNFDFINPKMSEHLWMYEGITEYFAQHFQVHENLVTEDEFLATMMKKIVTATNNYDDNLSFTKMSKNVLQPEMKAQYPNVYMKGALMAMCLDIIIRENSNGKRSLLSVMGELAKIYGAERSFNDSELFPKIIEITYPEVGQFIQQHIANGIPVDYDMYMNRVGIQRVKQPVAEDLVFLIGRTPYMVTDATRSQFWATTPDNNNSFYTNLGIQEGDKFLEINGKSLEGKGLNDFLMLGYNLEEGAPISVKVEREGEELTLSGTVHNNYVEGDGYKFVDTSKKVLKDQWLYN